MVYLGVWEEYWEYFVVCGVGCVVCDFGVYYYGVFFDNFIFVLFVFDIY